MKLNYKTVGEGYPLIILHGLFGSSDNWISIARKLEDNRKIYLLDQRNHGDSPHSDVFNYQDMASDLKEFIDDHKLSRVDLMGHSMGGKTAMLFAIQYPELVNKLIVVDIAPKYYPTHHDTIIKGLKSIDLQNIKSRNEADAALAKYVPTVGIRQFLLKNIKRTSEGFEWKINLSVIEKEIVEVGKALPEKALFEKPTLFIRGQLSNYILDEDMKLIQIHFPKSELVTINKASHWVHAEQPDLFLEETIKFING